MKKLTARQQDQLIQAAQYAFEFTVEGSGEFPADMLRYDHCWPASEADSRLLENPIYKPGRTRRVINLRGLTGPTPGRWASFGWTVLP